MNFVDAGAAIIAHRGGIWRTAHILSWVQTLKKLQKEDSTLTPTELIKRWNDTATREEKITGNKQQVLKNVLALPESVLEPMQQCVSELGKSGGKGRGKGCGKGRGKGCEE